MSESPRPLSAEPERFKLQPPPQPLASRDGEAALEMDAEDSLALQEDLAKAGLAEGMAIPEAPTGAATIEETAPPERRTRRRTQELPSVQRPADPRLELAGRLFSWILVPLIFMGVFYTILKRRPGLDAHVVQSAPALPIKGALVGITEISTGWRPRLESDRVSSETQTITKALVFPAHLPMLKLKVSPETQNGFLRILFFNSEGKIAGDARVVKIVAGQLQATSTGEQILPDRECTVVASTGMQSPNHLTDYLAGSSSRWSVEISESSNYQAKGDEWKPLQTFAIADTKL